MAFLLTSALDSAAASRGCQERLDRTARRCRFQGLSATPAAAAADTLAAPGALISSLDRFRQAQDTSRGGFAVALHELQAGRKTSHWSGTSSHIDAVKLVSSMTLFAHVAKTLAAADPSPHLAAMAAHAEAILAAAAAQGYDRCTYTADRLGTGRRHQ